MDPIDIPVTASVTAPAATCHILSVHVEKGKPGERPPRKETKGDAGIPGTKNSHRLDGFPGKVVGWPFRWDKHTVWDYSTVCDTCGRPVERRGWPKSFRVPVIDPGTGEQTGSRVCQFSCPCGQAFGTAGRTERGVDYTPRQLAGRLSTSIAFVFPRQTQRGNTLWYTTLYHDVNAGNFPRGTFEGQVYEGGAYTLDVYDTKFTAEHTDRVEMLVERPFVVAPGQGRWKLHGDVFVTGKASKVVTVETAGKPRGLQFTLRLRHMRKYVWWKSIEHPKGEWLPEFVLGAGEFPELELYHERGDERDELRWAEACRWDDFRNAV